MSVDKACCSATGSGGDVYDIVFKLAEVERENASLRIQLNAANERLDSLRKAVAKQNEEISQACGKALGYPWFKDDQKNFPGATEDCGVCVGEHVAVTIVEELAMEYGKAKERIRRLEEVVEEVVEESDIYERRKIWRKAKETNP